MTGNSKMITKKILTMLIFLLVIIVPVHAQGLTVNQYGQADQQPIFQDTQSQNLLEIITYESYADQFFVGAFQTNINACACQALTDTIRLTNTGQFDAVFNLEANLDFVNIPQSIVLRAGETQDIPVAINVPCNERNRVNSYEIKVRNNFGGERILQRTLTVNKCESIKAELFALHESIKPLDQNTYTINVTNIAPFIEEYIIEVTKGSRYFEETAFQLELNPGQSGIVNLTTNFDVPLYGEFDFQFRIISQKNNVKETLKHTLLIERDFDFLLEAQNISACTYTLTTTPIIVKNEGTITNNYTLSLIRGNGELSARSITLNPDEAARIDLYTYQENNRNRPYSILVEALHGDISKRVDFNINYETCYDLDLDIQVQDFKNICNGETQYQFEVTNNKEVTKNVISTIEFLGSFQNFNSTISPLESKIIPFNLSVPDNEDIKTYSILLTSSVEGSNKLFEDKKRIVVYGQNRCINTQVNDLRPRIRYFDDSLNVSIINRGIKSQYYEVLYEGSELFELKTKNITLAPNQRKNIEIISHATKEDVGRHYFKIILVSDTDIQEVEFRVNILSDSIHTNIINHLQNYTCLSITYMLLFVGIILLLILLITYLISTLRLELTTIKIIFLVLIPIILLFSLAMYEAPANLTPRTGEVGVDTPKLVMYQNTNLTVDLNNYFEDPDGDNLSFDFGIKPTKISAFILNSNLTLRSTNIVKDNFTIIATDNRAFTESPLFSVNVIEKQDITLRNYYDVYCAQTNVILLVFLILLLVLIPTSKRKK